MLIKSVPKKEDTEKERNMICKFCDAENPEGAVFCSSCGKRIDGKFCCPHCGKTNHEGASFCSHCGKRLDGKFACPTCGKMNDEGAAFCAHCGTRLDGKRECAYCGTPYEGKFCPNCGHSNEEPSKEVPGKEAEPSDGARETTAVSADETKPAEQTAAPADPAKDRPEAQPAPTEPEPEEKPTGWKRILLLVGGALGMCAAGLSLLFAFLAGTKAVIVPAQETTGGAINLFYFFFQGFKDVAEQLGETNVSVLYLIVSYLYVGLGAVIAAAMLICVLVFAVKTALKFARYVRGETNKGIGKLACATYLSYLIGVLGLLALQYMYTKVSIGEIVYTSTRALNGASIAGIVLGAICLIGYFGLYAAARTRELLKKNVLTELICSTVGIVLLIVLIGIVSAAGVCLSDPTTKSVVGFPLLMQTIVIRSGGMTKAVFADWLNAILALAAFGVLVAIMVFAAKELGGRAASFEKHSESDLKNSVILFILGAVFVILAIVLTNRYFDLSEAEGVQKSISSIIAVAVLVGLNLIRSITQTVLQKAIK